MKLSFKGLKCQECGKPLRRRKLTGRDFQNRTMHVKCWQRLEDIKRLKRLMELEKSL